MRIPKAFHPPLIAAFPVLALYKSNMALIPSADLWRPLAVAVAAVVVVWCLAAVVVRDWTRGALVASVIALWVLTYGHMQRAALLVVQGVDSTHVGSTFTWAWAVFGLALVVLAARPWRRSDALAALFNTMGAALVVMAVVGIGLNLMAMRRDVAGITSARIAAGSRRVTTTRPPDIFYIILDGHGSVDSLRDAMSFDDSRFVKGLEDRGFFVAKHSHSNYVQTELSLASSLNMVPIPELLPHIDPKSVDREPLEHLIDRSRASTRLRQAGYTTIAVTSGFPGLRFHSADLVARYQEGMSLFEATLVDDLPTPEGSFTGRSVYDARRAELHQAFRTLEELASPSSRPRFVFVHILAPHPPFVFKADGSAAPKPKGPFGFFDGSHFMAVGQTPQQYLDGYVGQVQYIDALTLKAIDVLLKGARTPPIIIIQGDHGSKLRLDQESADKTDLQECFRILNAYYVPPTVRAKLYPSITPVNSLRMVFDGLFGDALPPLPDRSAFSGWSTPYVFVDVTSRIKG